MSLNNFSINSFLAIAKEVSLLDKAQIEAMNIADKTFIENLCQKLIRSRQKFTAQEFSNELNKKPVLHLLSPEQF